MRSRTWLIGALILAAAITVSGTACGYGGANGTGDQQQWNASSSDDNVAPWNSDEISSWRTRYGC